MATISRFTRERAPCGKTVDGERHRDDDEAGLLFDDLVYACGCRESRHEFHDGTVRTRTVRHDGKVLLDDLSFGE